MPDASPLEFMRHRLDDLREQQLYRQVRIVTNGAEPWLELDGRSVLNLSSNNYLGLATHPEVVAAASAAAVQGAAGSARLVAGSSALHQVLEAQLARFKASESALLFNSGYTANTGIIPALVGTGDAVLSDEMNHASLIDGCRLSRAERRIYRHGDVAQLEEQLRSLVRAGHPGRRLVVTDAVFSMDGDVAPLADIASLCGRYGAMLLVDEAHSTGCLGPGGRGLVAELGLEHRVTVVMSTLSKALGSFGAFAAADQLVIDYLVNHARSFIFSTALPASPVAASLAALQVLEDEPWRMQRLQENAELFRRQLQSLGFRTLASTTQIVPVLVGDAGKTLAMAAGLLEEGIFGVAIRPPTVPAESARIRVSLMATHTPADVRFAVAAFARVGERLGLIDHQCQTLA
jgi:8-amino-7-oxononanoate synthase